MVAMRTGFVMFSNMRFKQETRSNGSWSPNETLSSVVPLSNYHHATPKFCS